MYAIDNIHLRTEINCEQGSKEWHMQRLGVITASNFDKVMVDGKSANGLGASAITYMNELVAEILTGQWDTSSFAATEWGKANEPFARERYEEETRCKVETIGFIKMGEREMIGFSPDGKVIPFEETKKIIEIKCPFKSGNHIENLKKGLPKKYYWQCMGGMMVTGATSCDFVSFDPRLKAKSLQLKIHTIQRDEVAIASLLTKLTVFENALHKELEEIGFF